MAVPAGALAHRGLAWLALLLAFVGWVLILSGVASLQQACSGSMVTTLSDLAQISGQAAPAGGRRLLQAPPGGFPGIGGFPGTVGYLAPVPCKRFFSFVWWIWAFDLFVLIYLALGVTSFIGTLRGGLVALSAVLLVLLMDTANTFLYFNHINGLTSTVAARARVLVAGAIISAIAYFLLIGIVGWHNEDAAVAPPYDAEAAGKKKGRKGAGAGGLLGGLLGRKKEERREEEEPGAAVPGSPRMIGVPRTPVVAQPAGSPHGGASPTAAAGYPAATTTTTATYTVPVAVPVSTQAAPIATRAL